MNGKGIRGLLRSADDVATEPIFWRVGAARIRRQVRRRRLAVVALPATAAAAVLLTTAVWVVCTDTARPVFAPRKTVSQEEQVKQWQTQAQSTLKLVHEVLERERRQHRLGVLEAELGRIPDPAIEIERQVDKTASLLLRQAERLSREPGRTEAAVEAYKNIIQRYPESRSADEARKRLSEIKQQRINKSDGKGAVRCEARRA